ncbi:glycoside hydrolase family 68 protein [Microbispora bryophytorum subsp. camponoti]
MNGEPARWTREHLAALAGDAATTAPVIGLPAPPRVLPDDDIWDLWPIQEEDGSTSVVRGSELWMALSAPALGHPEERHDRARLRLLAKDGDNWTDLGHAFADGVSPGSREWSGSAVRRPDGTVSVFYTAAGRRGGPSDVRPERRRGPRPAGDRRRPNPAGPGRRAHGDPALGRRDVPAGRRGRGGPGRIKAFRDPGWFRDPADGREYLLVAASVAASAGADHAFMGAVALAAATPGGWSLRPPLLVADGVNHEIERPHIVAHGSSYYLFFCTHRHSFHPPGSAPTGLYGFVAPSLTGPYTPLNGSGLVLRNPSEEPDQAYAWVVLPDLKVVGFVNYRSTGGTDPWQAEAAEARAAFGGTIAPVLELTLHGAATSLVVPVSTGAGR